MTPIARIFRNRYLRSAILWFLLPGVALLAIRIIWGREASQRLSDLRQRLHNEGLRVYAQDYPDVASIAPAENAAAGLVEAAQMLHSSSSFYNWSGEVLRHDLSGALDIQHTAQETAELRALAATYAGALEKLEEAGGRPQTIWPGPSARVGRNWSLDRSAITFMHHLLCNLALVEHADGHDGEALHCLRRDLMQWRILADRVDYYAVERDSRETLEVLHRLTPLLDLHPAANAAEARAILGELQDEWMQREAATNLESTLFRSFDAEPTHDWMDWWLAPLEIDRRARTTAQLADNLRSIRAPDEQTAKKLEVRGKPEFSDLVQGYYRPNISLRPSASERAGNACSRRAAALLLAARLYEAARGEVPTAASLLVPEYLPRIPLDPFSAHQQPLDYEVTPGGARVRSVGENGMPDTPGMRPDDLFFGAVPGTSARPAPKL